jgi:hypothetical protein
MGNDAIISFTIRSNVSDPGKIQKESPYRVIDIDTTANLSPQHQPLASSSFCILPESIFSRQHDQQKSCCGRQRTNFIFIITICLFCIHGIAVLYTSHVSEREMLITNSSVSKAKDLLSETVSSPKTYIPSIMNDLSNLSSLEVAISNSSNVRIRSNEGTDKALIKQEDIEQENEISMTIQEYVTQNLSLHNNVTDPVLVRERHDMIKHLEFAYTNLQELLNRPNRFPSVEERLKVYMSNWYIPPCDDTARIAYKYSMSSLSIVTLREISLQQHQDEVIENAKLNHAEQRVFDVNSDDTIDEIHYIDRQGFIQGKHNYHQDIGNLLLPSFDRYLNFTTGKGTKNNVPILYQFGNLQQSRVKLSRQSEGTTPSKRNQIIPYPRVPVMQRLRRSMPLKQLHGLTDDTKHNCYENTERHGTVSSNLVNNVYHRVHLEPIIVQLKSTQHDGCVYKVADVDTIPWENKKNGAIFRGALMGHYPESMTEERLLQLPARERCQLLPRCWLTYSHTTSKLVDAKLTAPSSCMTNETNASKLTGKEDKMIPRFIKQSEEDDNTNAIDLFGEYTPMHELLQYKALIILEGNDISSGLKWALFSNCIVLMPEPTVTSWDMEEMLRPWVHYIPININKESGYFYSNTDVEEKVQWILDNDEKARKIVKASTLWIADFILHPEAMNDEMIIYNEIARRYVSHFVPQE